MTNTLQLMPGESINGLFIRDAIVNHNQSVRSKEIWVGGFLHHLRLFTRISGSFVNRYQCQLRSVSSEVLNYEHTLNSLYYPLSQSQIDLAENEIDCRSMCSHNTDIQSIEALICIECYKEQIEMNGFFWLKTSWQNPYCRYCFAHDQQLVSAVPMLGSQILGGEVGQKNSLLKTTNLFDWIKMAETVKPLNDDIISLYRWFDCLRLAKLSKINSAERREIAMIVFHKIYGYQSINEKEIVDGLWKSFDTYTAINHRQFNSGRKLFFHGSHNRLCISRIFEKHYNGISTAQFWTIVYLGFKKFDVFYQECGYILKC